MSILIGRNAMCLRPRVGVVEAGRIKLKEDSIRFVHVASYNATTSTVPF